MAFEEQSEAPEASTTSPITVAAAHDDESLRTALWLEVKRPSALVRRIGTLVAVGAVLALLGDWGKGVGQSIAAAAIVMAVEAFWTARERMRTSRERGLVTRLRTAIGKVLNRDLYEIDNVTLATLRRKGKLPEHDVDKILIGTARARTTLQEAVARINEAVPESANQIDLPPKAMK